MSIRGGFFFYPQIKVCPPHWLREPCKITVPVAPVVVLRGRTTTVVLAISWTTVGMLIVAEKVGNCSGVGNSWVPKVPTSTILTSAA